MVLTSLQESLLKQIKNGKGFFSPYTEGLLIEEFQKVAKALMDLRSEGQIDMDEPQREKVSGKGYINNIYNCRLSKT